MEVIVTLVWLVYHDVASIRLKLEITDAVDFPLLFSFRNLFRHARWNGKASL